jgi:hypothetical protein
MKILSIALNTFRENLRDKLLYNLLVFALLMIGSSVILSRLTLGEFHRLILDLGLGSINFFGVLIAIFVGIGLVSKEIEKKTIYTIVSKPVARYQFLLGKYVGLTITLFVNTVGGALCPSCSRRGDALQGAGADFRRVHGDHRGRPAVFHVYQCHPECHLYAGDVCDRTPHSRPENIRDEDG